MTEARAPGVSVGLYVAAFALMLGAAALLAAVVPDVLHGGRSYTRLLRISAGLSSAAVLCSLLALVLLWRRAR